MKKNVHNVKNAFLAIVAIMGVIGCQEDLDDLTELVIDSKPIELKDGTLKFASNEVYEGLLEKSDDLSLPEFLSYQKILEEYKQAKGTDLRVSEELLDNLEGFQDTPLLGILDKDGMVIIGDYLFSLDFERELVGVTNNSSLKNQMISKNFEHKNIRKFTFETDILSELDLAYDSSVEGVEKKYSTYENFRIQNCPGNIPPGTGIPLIPSNRDDVLEPDKKVEFTLTWVSSTFLREYRATALHVYQPAGIYFRLKTELSHDSRLYMQTNNWTPEPDSNMSVFYWGSFKPKNRSTVNLYNCWDSCQGCWPQPANRDKVQKVHWEAARRLDVINLYGIFRGRLGGDVAITTSGYEFRLQPILRN